jgi:hypothetical protein
VIFLNVFLSGKKLMMMNASLDLECTKMHYDLDEKEEMGEDSSDSKKPSSQH